MLSAERAAMMAALNVLKAQAGRPCGSVMMSDEAAAVLKALADLRNATGLMMMEIRQNPDFTMEDYSEMVDRLTEDFLKVTRAVLLQYAILKRAQTLQGDPRLDDYSGPPS